MLTYHDDQALKAGFVNQIKSDIEAGQVTQEWSEVRWGGLFIALTTGTVSTGKTVMRYGQWNSDSQVGTVS